MTSWRRVRSASLICLLLSGAAAHAQQLDMTQGGPIEITARDGIEWRQAEQKVIARGDAKAMRGTVTVTADTLTAWYRKKANAAGSDAGAKPSDGRPGAVAAAAKPATRPGNTATTLPSRRHNRTDRPRRRHSSEGNEIYRLQADGNVHIFTQTDQA